MDTNCLGYNTANDIKKPVITSNITNPAAPILTSSAETGNQWFKDGEAISNATAKDYTVIASGTYSVSFSNGNCLFAISDNLLVEPVEITSLPTDLVQYTGNFKIYPNPAVENFTLEINVREIQETDLMIYNHVGIIVTRETLILNEGVNKINFNCTQFSRGGYIIKIITKEAVISQKLTLN